MALSEGEQRRLDEIERGLLTEDPGFAATITISRVRRHRTVLAGLVFLVGMLALVAGLVATDAALWVGVTISVLGIAAMAVGAMLYLRPRRLRLPAFSRRRSGTPRSRPRRSRRAAG